MDEFLMKPKIDFANQGMFEARQSGWKTEKKKALKLGKNGPSGKPG